MLAEIPHNEFCTLIVQLSGRIGSLHRERVGLYTPFGCFRRGLDVTGAVSAQEYSTVCRWLLVCSTDDN